MSHRVIIKRKAQRDLDESLVWWSRHGKAAAAEWRERFVTNVIATLEHDPNRFPAAEEAAEVGLDLRVMLYGRRRQVYRVLFTIEENIVSIHRVRHAAQDWLKEGDVYVLPHRRMWTASFIRNADGGFVERAMGTSCYGMGSCREDGRRERNFPLRRVKFLRRPLDSAQPRLQSLQYLGSYLHLPDKRTHEDATTRDQRSTSPNL